MPCLIAAKHKNFVHLNEEGVKTWQMAACVPFLYVGISVATEKQHKEVSLFLEYFSETSALYDVLCQMPYPIFCFEEDFSPH